MDFITLSKSKHYNLAVRVHEHKLEDQISWVFHALPSNCAAAALTPTKGQFLSVSKNQWNQFCDYVTNWQETVLSQHCHHSFVTVYSSCIHVKVLFMPFMVSIDYLRLRSREPILPIFSKTILSSCVNYHYSL